MSLKGPTSPTSSISFESSPWQLARLVWITFQPWPPGTPLRDDGRQEQGARQVCQRVSQRIHGARAQGGIRQVSSCLCRLAQTIFPTDHRMAPLGWSRAADLGAAAAGGSGEPRLSPPPTFGPCGACCQWGRLGEGGAGMPKEIPFASAWR